MSIESLNTPALRASHSLQGKSRALSAATTMHYFEALESRQLLSGEYSVLSVSQPLGSHIVAGTIVKGNSAVVIENVSNADNSIAGDIHVVARPTGALNADNDVPLGQLLNLNVAPTQGHSKSYPVKLTLPANAPIGSYNILALVTAPNSGLLIAADFGDALSIDAPVFDLTAIIGKDLLPASLIANSAGSHTVQVSIGNVGNIPGSATEKARVQLFARPIAGGPDQLLATSADFSIAKIAANPLLIKSKLKSITIPVLNTSFLTGAYHLVAIVTDATPGNDTDAANDSVVDSPTVTVAGPFIDLKVDTVTDTLASAVAGGTAGTINVVLENLGNILDTAGYTVDLFATTDGTIHGGDLPVGTTTSSAKVLNGATAKVAVKIALPSPVAQATYTLVARVTTPGDNSTANNLTAGGQVIVTATPPLLGNLPTSMTFVEVDAPAGAAGVQLTSAGDVQYPGGHTSNDSGYFYSTQGPSKMALLQPTIAPFGLNNIELKFTVPRPNSLNGKTIIFQLASAGASGTFSVISATQSSGITLPANGFFRIT